MLMNDFFMKVVVGTVLVFLVILGVKTYNKYYEAKGERKVHVKIDEANTQRKIKAKKYLQKTLPKAKKIQQNRPVKTKEDADKRLNDLQNL